MFATQGKVCFTQQNIKIIYYIYYYFGEPVLLTPGQSVVLDILTWTDFCSLFIYYKTNFQINLNIKYWKHFKCKI